MRGRYCVGRSIPGTAAYDLEDCPLFNLITDAVEDLIERVSDQDPGNAGHLQLLCCKCRGDDVLDYEPVRSGALIEALIAMQKLKHTK